MSKKTIRLYLILLCGLNASIALTFGSYVLFLERNGLNLFQINLVNFFFMFTMVIMELPTGSWADTFSRKNSFLLCCLFYVLGGLWYFYFRGFWNFVAAEVMLAIGSCFLSGAFDAWLVDSLHHYGFNGDLKKIFSQKQCLTKLVQIPATIVGVWIATFDLSYVWLFKAIGCGLVGMAALCLMREDYPLPQRKETDRWFSAAKEMWQKTKIGIGYGLSHRPTLILVGTTTVLTFTVQPLNMFWPLHFEKMLGTISYHGLIMSAINVCMLLGILAGSKFLPACRCRDHQCLLIGFGITAAGMISAGVNPWFWPTLVFFLSHEVGRGVIAPLVDASMHHQVDAAKRATVLSFQGMSNKLGASAGLFLFGVLGDSFGISLCWLIAGLVLLVVTPMLWQLKK